MIRVKFLLKKELNEQIYDLIYMDERLILFILKLIININLRKSLTSLNPFNCIVDLSVYV